ncbi:MAG: hypothetical protein KKA67_10335 [Spirochaetes bacterium]|nr:hypothetical protein [Spirochaetota bacterium]MBU1079709.1 hypothetical protein [Spirochaetota bacterium]
MTIKLRERVFRGLFVVSVAASAAAVALVWWLGPLGLERVRASGFGRPELAAFYTGLAAAGACGVYGTIVSGLIAFRSGKTVSVEIFFFSLWAFCQSFELTRVAAVALVSVNSGSVVFELLTRAALFGRYGGTIAVFAGSLFSVGLKQERGEPLLGATLMAGLLFASIHPLNSVGPGVDFLVARGVEPLARAFESAVILMAVVNYGIAWWSGRDKAYSLAGAGLVVCVASTMALRGASAPWLVAVAVPALGLGTWIYIKSLHDYYLWR